MKTTEVQSIMMSLMMQLLRSDLLGSDLLGSDLLGSDLLGSVPTIISSSLRLFFSFDSTASNT